MVRAQSQVAVKTIKQKLKFWSYPQNAMLLLISQLICI